METWGGDSGVCVRQCRFVTQDKAGKAYWDQTYEAPSLPRVFDPHPRGVRNYAKRRFHAYFSRLFAHMATSQADLLEIGCGASTFLPYLGKEFGFNVSGIDYSEAGCDVASRTLAREGVHGNIICADAFHVPEDMFGHFDVVVSFGVAEHFSNTAACIAAFSKFLKPGGLIITFIPNLVGLIGLLERVLDRSVYEKHVLLDRKSLQAAHQDAGLLIQSCDYFLFANFGVANINEIPKGSVEWYAKRAVLKSLEGLTGMIWFLETVLWPFPSNRITSPYVVCAAKKES